MNFPDLFAGIGGFSPGLERAGMTCVGQVEIDEYCQWVLAAHWPLVVRYGDIRKVDGSEFKNVDLVCGGFPCQPFSLAGKRRGLADDRYLWPEMRRIIKRIRPRWVLLENVPGIVRVALDGVLADLEGEAYTCQPFIIPACAVDARHRRDRVWIVAYTEYSGLYDPEIAGGPGPRTDPSEGEGGAEQFAGPGSGTGWNANVADPSRRGLPLRGGLSSRQSPEKRGSVRATRRVAPLWPTPSSRDWKDTPGMARTGVNPDGSKRTRNDQLARRVYQESNAPHGTLNPSRVAWLMGFPTGWFDSVHWGTRSSRRSSRRSEG